jgi:hypothetical protein
MDYRADGKKFKDSRGAIRAPQLRLAASCYERLITGRG